MLTTVRYILLTALRDWLFAGLFIAIFIAFGVSMFLGGTALVEENQMSVVYMSGGTRVILLIGLIVFVCFHVRRSFENREIEVILSRPISRSSFVFAYWLGFAVVSLIPVTALSVAIWLFTEASSQGLMFWTFSLMLESFLVVAFALFSALILRSAVSSVLLCFGFYFIARMMGFFLYIMEKPYLFKTFDLGFVSEKILWFVSIILPRLDLFGKSDWLVYGVTDYTNFIVFVPQALIYIPLLLTMAVLDFKRKQF